MKNDHQVIKDLFLFYLYNLNQFLFISESIQPEDEAVILKPLESITGTDLPLKISVGVMLFPEAVIQHKSVT